MARFYQPAGLSQPINGNGSASEYKRPLIDDDTFLLIWFVGGASLQAYFVGRLFR